MKRLAYAAISLFTLLLFANCGGSSNRIILPPTTPGSGTPNFVMGVDPGNAVVDQGATKQFTAVFSGTTDTRVKWSVQEGSAGGTISTLGLYTAPPKAGTYHVTATSQQDTSRSATVPVMVNDIILFVTPNKASVEGGGTQKFAAVVYGTVLNTSVTWKVLNGGDGTINSDGIFTAGSTSGGPIEVEATSMADTTKTAVGSVWVDARKFHAAADMLVQRAKHTATLLPNGNVLIAGGAGQAGAADPGAEIFVMASGTFQAAAAMHEVRYGHTATMLNNGKILIAGGKNSSNVCTQCYSRTAELYDPATNTFTPTSSMTVERGFHVAALLHDGRVMVAGGATNSADKVDSAEIYDPGSGQWSAVNSMSTKRVGHTAAVLQNGKVFIAGGEGTSSDPYTADIYDPAAGTYSKLPLAPRSRNWLTSTLLANGDVLLGGGGVIASSYFPYYNSRRYIYATNLVSNDISLYDPRMFHAATLLAASTEQVLLTGGTTLYVDTGDSSEIYEGGEFRPAARLLHPRKDHAATLLTDGSVLITGGSSDKTTEIFK